MMLQYNTTSPEESLRLGRALGTCLRSDDVIGLIGDLGSGKTCFARGLALGLGVSEDQPVTSPTFALVHEYDGRAVFYHMDVYRLEDVEGFLAAGLEEYFYAGGVAAVEWADRWPEVFPARLVRVVLEIRDDHTRRITLVGDHARSSEILQELCEAVAPDLQQR